MDRIAVIDIGSNSVRMQVSEVLKQSYRTVDIFRELIRVGDDLYRFGYITEDKVGQLIDALRQMKMLADARGVVTVRAIATASLRDADNGPDVAHRIFQETGISVEIVSGEEEARYTFLAAQANFQLADVTAIVLDIGGGSAEITVVENGVQTHSCSTPLGCTRLTIDHCKNDPLTQDDIQSLRKHIAAELKKVHLPRTADIVICTGGTMNNVALVSARRDGFGDAAVKSVGRKFLKKFLADMQEKTVAERQAIRYIEPKRADIMFAAATVVDMILESTSCTGFFTLSGGLRTGLTIETMNRLGEKLPFQSKQMDVHFARLMEIGHKFHFDEKHAKAVTRIALSLFDGLASPYALPERGRRMLEAAAMLHDIGYYISYEKHHVHSQHIISNTELVGLSARETELVAHIARYHRKSEPKPSHELFMKLPPAEQTIVRMLSAILRLADGLDRSHRSLVKKVTVDVQEQEIHLHLNTAEDTTLEMRGVQEKKPVFESTYGKRLVIV